MQTADLSFMESRFNAKGRSLDDDKDSMIIESVDPPISIFKTDINQFSLPSDQLNFFDVVIDEQPFLEMAHGIPNASIETTLFGHALKKGGLIYLQTEGAKNFRERTKLLKRVNEFYPDSHFSLIDTRRLSWTRQFLFLKCHDTC